VPASPVHVLLLAGPAGVGKSTLSWEISAQLRRVGLAHVALDSDELDRVWPLSDTDQEALNRANLAAFWANAAALGHTRLILAGVFLNAAAARSWIEASIPGASLTRVVLHAGAAELERRVRVREIGSESDEQLARTLAQAKRFGRRGEAPGGAGPRGRDTFVLSTDGMTVPELARRAIACAGWTEPEETTG
jgi:predicted ABC-type ATPase